MKNIVLLSDGTGNSSAKKNKTNVWRLYSALDLHDENQIAMYDDGVGSKDSLWSRVMGGVFGWGLKRNVIGLYKYLCRNYEYENNDKIYLFGFSRGAFTVRVLASFITEAGLCVSYGSEEELHKKAMQNYRYFRYECYKNKFTGFASRLLYKLLRLKNSHCGDKDENGNSKDVNIEFIGVWDTVAAYGFPIDELANLWDKLIYPLRFSNQKLSPKVKAACHAISVDDERHSFHPLVWDESEEDTDRIQQVWFPGVHSDVGGGYSRQSLSMVALDWMLARVEADSSADGLLFIDDIRRQYHSQSDWNGPQHDSRAGLGMYYRYKPRNIEQICNDKRVHVSIARPKIHQSVFERIKGRSVPYAPTGIPAEYEVISTNPVDPYETPEQSSKRTLSMNNALDMIYWRREIYFLILFITFLLFVSRFFLDWDENGICQGSACFVDPVLQTMMNTLPDFAAGWVDALRQNPKVLWSFTFLFILLLTLRHFAWIVTRRRAICAWAVLKGRSDQLLPEWKPGLTAMLRNLSRIFAPVLRWMSGLGLFILIIYLILCTIDGVVFHLRYTTGSLCKHASNITDLTDIKTIQFDISDACHATGIRLMKGTTYNLKVSDSVLHDGDRRQTNANGFSDVSMIPFVPLRRHISQPWLKLFGKIDKKGFETFALGTGEYEYTPHTDGELFLYVNDAVFGLLPKWDLPYHWEAGANKGQLTVTIWPK